MSELLHETRRDVPVAIALHAAKLAADIVGIDLTRGRWPDHLDDVADAMQKKTNTTRQRSQT